MTSDPYRSALRASLFLTPLGSMLGLIGGAVLSRGVWWERVESVPLLIAPAWVLLSSLRSVRILSRTCGVLSESDVSLHWDRMATTDAVGLAPWGLLLLIRAVAPWGGNFSANVLYSIGLGLCAGVHLLLLPMGLNLIRLWRRTPAKPLATTADPIRSAFKAGAKIRLGILVVGTLAWLGPWMSVVEARGFRRSPTPSGLDPAASGVELLLGSVNFRTYWSAWDVAGATIVLGCLALWEMTRCRWPSSPRWTHTRVFATWGLVLAASATPMYCWGLEWYHLYFRLRLHSLEGAWANLVVWASLALVLLAVTPLLLTRALRARADADRQAQLEAGDFVPEA